jgi:hypothetical protein
MDLNLNEFWTDSLQTRNLAHPDGSLKDGIVMLDRHEYVHVGSPFFVFAYQGPVKYCTTLANVFAIGNIGQKLSNNLFHSICHGGTQNASVVLLFNILQLIVKS